LSGTAPNNGWKFAASTATNAVKDSATAFQINFNTTGYNGITFSATQKSTESGPARFRLMYRTSATGTWVEVPNSVRTVTQEGGNNYNALEATYIDFALPTAVNAQATVQLRVVFDGPANLEPNGNTSINDIQIRGTSTTNRTVTINRNDGSSNTTQTVANGSIAIEPAVTRNGWVLAGWRSNATGTPWFTFDTPITANITLTAQWLRLGAVSTDGSGNVTSGDATWLARAIAGHAGFDLPQRGTTRFNVFDVDGNGVIEPADITALAQWLVGQDITIIRANAAP
jgi:hypothetical protein